MHLNEYKYLNVKVISMGLNTENVVTDAKTAGSDSFEKIFNDVLVDRWINLTDDMPHFSFFSSVIEFYLLA